MFSTRRAASVQEKVVQCDERVYSIKRATFAVRGECVWLKRSSAVSGKSHLQ